MALLASMLLMSVIIWVKNVRVNNDMVLTRNLFDSPFIYSYSSLLLFPNNLIP
jgi:hypothetical protein